MSEALSVRYFAPDMPALARRLRQKLIDVHDKQLGELRLSQDWPDHKYRIGILDGLQQAINECLDVESDMEMKPNDRSRTTA